MADRPFPRLRRKGRAFYFDCLGKPRRWIPLGSDEVKAVEQYRKLIATQGLAGTVSRMLAEYLTHLTAGAAGSSGKPLTKSTLAQYRSFAMNLNAVFADTDPRDITQATIRKYLRGCDRTNARGEIGLLSGAYWHAMDAGTVAFNPCAGVKCGKPKARRDRLLTDDELALVREHAPQKLRVAIDLAYLTGMRPSDMIRLRWSDFGDSFVEHQKTGFRQRFRVTDDLRAVLDAARALQGRVASLYVLCGRAGQPLSRTPIGNWWRKACKAAGVQDAQWRDIRAKAGTDAEAAGADAQKFLGHTSPLTTKLYLRGKRIVTVDPLRKKGAA